MIPAIEAKPKSMTESAIRRRARTAGYALCKCRTRNPDNPEYGTYQLAENNRPSPPAEQPQHAVGLGWARRRPARSVIKGVSTQPRLLADLCPDRVDRHAGLKYAGAAALDQE